MYKHTYYCDVYIFFWAGSFGTSLASQKFPAEHRLRLLLAGPFQLFFAFYTCFVLRVLVFFRTYFFSCHFFRFFSFLVHKGSSSSNTTTNRNTATPWWQQQQAHTVVRMCRPEWDNASKHAYKSKPSVAESQPCTIILWFFFSSFFVSSSFIAHTLHVS